jgi:hypothetical protein
MKFSQYILKYHLVFVFLAIIALPLFNDLTGLWKFERKDENRAFRDSVSIDVNYLDIFPGEFEEYLNDNFSFRRPLLDFYHHFKFYYFKVSPHPNKTIIGLNGWFFNAEEEIEIYEGKKVLSDQDLKKFLKEWKYRKHYLDSSNIRFYWMIAPTKHNVYSENLPFNIHKSDKKKNVDQLKAVFQDELPGLIIDPTPELIAAKKMMKVYYQLDNHWNLRAGYMMSNLILSKIKSDFPDANIGDIPTYVWRDSIIQKGIHYKVLGIEELSETEKYPVIEKEFAVKAKKYGFKAPKYFPYKWNYERRFVNNNMDSGLRILVIRDSFGDKLMPFLKEPFQESVFLFDAWQYKLNKPIIEKVKPDIVVFISLETNIDNIIAN